MDEFPSMYSCPRLSRRIAPRPSTRTSGSKLAAHQSRMSVNGCQTNFLSAVINRSVFHSLITVYPFEVLGRVSPLPFAKGEDEGEGLAALRSSSVNQIASTTLELLANLMIPEAKNCYPAFD